MKRSAEIELQAFAFRLDEHSGVPVYRQLMDQVQAAIASGALTTGSQLPTVRQVAVDLTINPNTVSRAYREMEIRGLLDTQQGTGTFIADRKVEYSKDERDRLLSQLAGEFVSRAGAAGFTLKQLIKTLKEMQPDEDEKRK
ncbi:MAG TPA: GntR family transcriptional regulator [Acidobacteriaceae bacterium]|jgi:GntR family transcriptional regulator|nr:GntR family transcriptional regulator [Acidobacteriaceae bacterium]